MRSNETYHIVTKNKQAKKPELDQHSRGKKLNCTVKHTRLTKV